jgi:hypothetical protein
MKGTSFHPLQEILHGALVAPGGSFACLGFARLGAGRKISTLGWLGCTRKIVCELNKQTKFVSGTYDIGIVKSNPTTIYRKRKRSIPPPTTEDI